MDLSRDTSLEPMHFMFFGIKVGNSLDMLDLKIQIKTFKKEINK